MKKAATSKTQPAPILPELLKWLARTPQKTSVDVLLTKPLEAIRMSIDVAERTGRMNSTQAVALRNALACLDTPTRTEVDAINEICRAAMNARKRGQLKTPNTKAPTRQRRRAKHF